MKLIVSYRTYDWVKHCAGLIMRDPKQFDVMVVCKDDDRQIFGHNSNFCEDALYAQRHYDLGKIGKKLNVRKVMNLLYDDRTISNAIERLIMQIQLQITIGGVSKVYYYSNDLLKPIFDSIEKSLGVETLAYGTRLYTIKEGIELNKEEFSFKESLNDLIVAKHRVGEIISFEDYHELFGKEE